MELYTPGVSVPAAYRSFTALLAAGRTYDVLVDPGDRIAVGVTAVQVDPANPRSTAVGRVDIRSGADRVSFTGKGELLVNGAVVGRIGDPGLVAGRGLPDGGRVSTALATDDAAGNAAERFVFSNGAYRVTAAVRRPHPHAEPYLDVNVEELRSNAANDATGWQATVAGTAVGLADLLRLERP
jgi:hypothetical protein